MGLNSQSRVYTQGVRNANDAVSLLNVADGAAGELSNTLMRLKELASSAANGTLSRTQRVSLDGEALALTNEYNRLINATSFNNLGLLNGAMTRMNIQLGYGTSSVIGFGLGQELDRTTGSGTFGSAVTNSFDVANYASGDFNGDGQVEIVAVTAALEELRIGRMTSTGTVNWTTIDSNVIFSEIATGDVNGDGKLDMVATSGTAQTVYLGNGNNTFKAGVSYSGTGASLIQLSDLNGDGRADIVLGRTGGVAVRLANSDGTFQAAVTYSGGAGFNRIATGDVNGDGRNDVIGTSAGDGNVFYMLSNGDGTLGSLVSIGGSSGASVQAGDFNFDGLLDVVTSTSGGTLLTFLGTGSGNFKAGGNYSGGTGANNINLADTNGDGVLDIVTTALDSTVNVLLGNSDGTFAARKSYNLGFSGGDFTVGDFTGDGAVDLMIGTSSSTNYALVGNSQALFTLSRLNLTTREMALSALGQIEAALARVSSEQQVIGSMQSRLSTALSNLTQLAENTETAASRMTDIDVAEESAELMKNQIRQQAGAALLGQANFQSSIALSLLQF